MSVFLGCNEHDDLGLHLNKINHHVENITIFIGVAACLWIWWVFFFSNNRAARAMLQDITDDSTDGISLSISWNSQ